MGRGVGSRFEKPNVTKLPLEDIVVPQRVPLERYTDIEVTVLDVLWPLLFL